MQVIKTNSINNHSVGAALRVTQAAKESVYKNCQHNTFISNLVFSRALDKFRNRICGEFPFAGDVFFDTISKKTKSMKPNTSSKYELRLFDKTVDFDFNHNRIFYNHENKPIEEKVEQEANAQANYLFDSYLYLRRQCGH